MQIHENTTGAEEFFQKFCADHAVNLQTAMEMMADIANHLGEHGNTSATAKAEQYHVMRQWIYESILCFKHVLQEQPNTHPDSLRTLDSILLAMGFPVGTPPVTEVAALSRVYGVKKQTINKVVRQYQDTVKIPPAPNQRTPEQRSNMKDARVRQVKSNRGI